MQRCECFAVCCADFGHLGGHAHREVAPEMARIADNRIEIEVIGIRAFEIDGGGRGIEVAECGDVAAQREPEERYVCQPDTRGIVAAAAEIGLEHCQHASQCGGVGNGLEEYPRCRGIHHQLLAGVVIPGDGYVVGDEILVVHDALEVIAHTHVDIAADGEGDLVGAARKYHLRQHRLLESAALRLQEVEYRAVDGQLVTVAGSIAARVRCSHFLSPDQIDYRLVIIVARLGHG